MSAIKKICATNRLDLRGNPSLEVIVELESGHFGVVSVPLTLDLNTAITNEEILNDIHSVNEIICKELQGKDSRAQLALDKIMMNVNKENGELILGKNATMAVSIAAAKAAASYCNLPLYRYIGGANINLFPVPMSTVLSGGVDVNNNVNIKEFMLVPVGFANFADLLCGSLKVFNKIGELLEKYGKSTNLQNGYISNLNSDEEALELICEAIIACGYNLGDDFFIGLNVGASEWEIRYHKYKIPKTSQLLATEQVIDYLFELCQKYPIIFLEDPLGKGNLEGYRKLKIKMLDVQIAESSALEDMLRELQTEIYSDIANAAVVHLKDVRTLSELMNLVNMARQNNYKVIISDRGVNKENSLIADIILGLGISQVKIGTPIVADRACKYKRFLELEEKFHERLRNVANWSY